MILSQALILVFSLWLNIALISFAHANDFEENEEEASPATEQTQPIPPISDYDRYKDSIRPEQFKNKARLLALNKITAHTSEFDVKLKKEASFGTLRLTLHSCWKSPPEDEPESKALVEISEQHPGQDKKNIFLGWLITSSPAASSIEHPVYDITLLDCFSETEPVAKP